MVPFTTSRSTARCVPVSLSLQVLFGGRDNQVGWFLLAIGLGLIWAAVLQSELVTFWQFLGPLTTTRGVVTGSGETDSAENDTSVYAITYTFTPAGAAQHITGTSYQLGNGLDPDTEVTVEYDPTRPEHSRIKGMRTAKIGFWAPIIALIFPVIGLYIVVSGLFRSIRTLFMLARGLPATGTLSAIDDTGDESEKGKYYRVQFDFTTAHGASRTCAINITAAEMKDSWQAYYDNRHAQARPQEVILYHPSHPDAALLLAEIDPRLGISDQGRLTGGSLRTAVSVLILPLGTLIGHGWYVYTYLLR